MSSSKANWLKVSGTCGIVAPVVAFASILLAVAFYPPFSWTENALSDLGVQAWPSSVLFNCGLVVSGVLALVFGVGLFRLQGSRASGKVGAFMFMLTALALIGIGVFNEDSGSLHRYFSVSFFTLFPLSMLVLVVVFLAFGKLRMSLFTFLVAVSAAAPWIAYFAIHYVEGVAIPETISGLAASLWMMVLSFKMLK